MHGLETYITEEGNQLATFASLRVPAWHGLGTVFDRPVTTQGMLEIAHLAGWNLRFENAQDAMPGYVFNKETKFVVRDNPFIPGQKDVLGTVGKRYNIFSNEEILNFGDALLNGRRRWETAGSIQGGTRIFATLVDTDDIVLDPSGSNDIIRKYLMVTSSHDASSTLVAKKVNTRVVCQNTLNVAMGEIGDEFRIRHTEGMAAKLEDAQRALGYADAYDEIFEAQAKKMIQTKVTKDKFFEIVKDFYPQPEDNAKGRNSKWEFKADSLMYIWEGKTGGTQNLEDTAWKALQTLTEHGQWFRGIRGGNLENYLAAGAGFDNVTNDERQDMWNRVLARAN